MKLENGTIILIADGQKYLMLKNMGDEKYPNLTTISHEQMTNPAAHDQATDRAGIRHSGHQTAVGKSAMEQTDWHRVAKQEFAAHTADILNKAVARGGIKRLVLVAGPDTLGEIRDELSAATKALLVGEVIKDLTNKPLNQIEKILMAS